MVNNNNQGIRIIPLGGIGEIGKNITIIESEDEMIIIDCGITFPRDSQAYGVDIIVPDFSYIVENAHKLKALVLTHGHEDHIGAVPFLMREVAVPKIIGTRFTLALVKAKADEWGLIAATQWVEAKAGDEPISVGDFELEFVRVTHSIPDCVSVAVHTDHGTIFHTGDFKLDPTPLDGLSTDLGHISEIASEGISLLLSDSTQADVPGHSGSEVELEEPLRDICSRASGRIIATCFSSHIHRIQQLINIATENNRAVCLLGRSMNRNSNIAKSLQYLDVSHANMIKPNKIDDYRDSKVMIICTGSQGEPLAALSRIAAGSHPRISARQDDTFIFSSRTIPGNDTQVHEIQNHLAKVGAKIYSTDTSKVHVSGHGSRSELSTMLKLTDPDYFIPVHGEWRHLRAHLKLATNAGMQEEQMFVCETGQVATLRDGHVSMSDETVHVGIQLVDRNSNDQIFADIMEERQQVSNDGVLIVSLHTTSGDIDVSTRGFITDDEKTIATEIYSLVEDMSGDDAYQYMDTVEISNELQESIENRIYQLIKRKPLVVPVVMR